MAWNNRIKLEPRGEKDPKFDINNKTDRKILLTIIISLSILVLIAVGLFVVYYVFFKQ
jgi:flagellar basal body-associated protein FliL